MTEIELLAMLTHTLKKEYDEKIETDKRFFHWKRLLKIRDAVERMIIKIPDVKQCMVHATNTFRQEDGSVVSEDVMRISNSELPEYLYDGDNHGYALSCSIRMGNGTVMELPIQKDYSDITTDLNSTTAIKVTGKDVTDTPVEELADEIYKLFADDLQKELDRMNK